jgi:glycosyltransferase involved in cell wall biosynthesis
MRMQMDLPDLPQSQSQPPLARPPARPLRTLFLFHLGSNAGYAIAPLEKLFFRTGLELASGDAGLVHFAYRELTSGPPRALPAGFRNVIAHDFFDRGAANVASLAAYARNNGIELVVGFDFEPIDPLVAALRRAGVRRVIAYWGAPISTRPPPLPKLLLKAARFALSRSKVDSLIFESRAMVESATRGRGLPESILDVVPLGVDISRYRPAHPAESFQANSAETLTVREANGAGSPSNIHDAFGFERGRRIVVYSGHMEPRKGVAVLVEAAIALLRRRSDVAFLICGNRGDEASAYAARIAEAGAEKHIRLGGYRSDLAEIFPRCFAGVIASTGWDSFTYSAVELAACGLPVVASRLQGLAEAVLDGRTGLLFAPGDAAALAQRLEQLLDDPALAQRLGRAGRLRAEQELSLEAQARAFKAVLLKRMQ